MVQIKKKMTLPEYRERKEIYEALGYKEVEMKVISDYKVSVTFEIDENDPYYPTIRKIERKLYRKGPPFFPTIIFIVISFILLSVYVILLAKEGKDFNVMEYFMAFTLPAIGVLLLAVAYTFFYFYTNKKIIEEAPLNKEDITSIVNRIRNK